MLWELSVAFLNTKNHPKNYSSGDPFLNFASILQAQRSQNAYLLSFNAYF